MTDSHDREQGADGERFRTYIGSEVWDTAALDRAYADLQKRCGRAETEPARPASMSAQQSPTPYELPQSAESVKPDEQSLPPTPDPGWALSVAAVAVAVVVAIGFGTCWLVDAASTNHVSEPTIAIATTLSIAPSTAPATSTGTGTEADLSPSPVDSSLSSLADPTAVVEAYYEAINQQDYDTYIAGFADTASDSVTALDTSATTVSIQLTATQTDGNQKQYSGTYVVINGEIISANISQVG